MSGEQEPWVFRGGLTADLQVIPFISRFFNTRGPSFQTLKVHTRVLLGSSEHLGRTQTQKDHPFHCFSFVEIDPCGFRE